MEDRSGTRLVGVYDADGGLLGEAAYVWGKIRGTRHCALCDLTHGLVRRKPEWDQMVADLGIPMDLWHLNELPDDVRQAVAECGAPVFWPGPPPVCGRWWAAPSSTRWTARSRDSATCSAPAW